MTNHEAAMERLMEVKRVLPDWHDGSVEWPLEQIERALRVLDGVLDQCKKGYCVFCDADVEHYGYHTEFNCPVEWWGAQAEQPPTRQPGEGGEP